MVLGDYIMDQYMGIIIIYIILTYISIRRQYWKQSIIATYSVVSKEPKVVRIGEGLQARI